MESTVSQCTILYKICYNESLSDWDTTQTNTSIYYVCQGGKKRPKRELFGFFFFLKCNFLFSYVKKYKLGKQKRKKGQRKFFSTQLRSIKDAHLTCEEIQKFKHTCKSLTSTELFSEFTKTEQRNENKKSKTASIKAEAET